MRSRIRPVAFLFLFMAFPSYAESLTIISKVTRDGGPPETKASYISSDHVRISQGDGREFIVDFNSGQMTTLDTRKKTYYVITRADMDAFATTMREQMKKAEEGMKNLPPEQRRKMDSAAAMFAVDVRDLGTSRKIAGYTCENWSVNMGRYSRTEECLTSELKFPPQAWDMYRGFADNMKSMMAALGPMAKSAAAMQEQFKKMKGYPLANTTTTEIMGRKSVVASEVTEIRHDPIPPSTWEVPAGYTKTDNPMMKAMQPRTRK